MDSNILVGVVVQLILACAPLNSQAAALDRDLDPEQLWNIGWELSKDYHHHRDPLQVKHNKQALFRDRGGILRIHQPSDLLQELLSSSDTSNESNQITEEMATDSVGR